MLDPGLNLLGCVVDTDVYLFLSFSDSDDFEPLFAIPTSSQIAHGYFEYCSKLESYFWPVRLHHDSRWRRHLFT